MGRKRRVSANTKSQAAKKGWETRRRNQRERLKAETEEFKSQVMHQGLLIAEYEGRLMPAIREMAEEYDVTAAEVYTFFMSPHSSDFQPGAA